MSVGAALAIGSSLVSLFGSLKSAQANEKYDNYLNKRETDLDNWYNKEYNTNFLDTTQGRSAVGALRTQYGETMKRVNQNSAISGASDEAKVAVGDKVQRGMADQVSRIAGYGTVYKDNIRREYQGLKHNLQNMQQNNLLRKSENWSTLMDNSTKAGIGFAEADANGAFDGVDGWLKNLFGKIKVDPTTLAG